MSFLPKTLPFLAEITPFLGEILRRAGRIERVHLFDLEAEGGESDGRREREAVEMGVVTEVILVEVVTVEGCVGGEGEGGRKGGGGENLTPFHSVERI